MSLTPSTPKVFPLLSIHVLVRPAKTACSLDPMASIRTPLSLSLSQAPPCQICASSVAFCPISGPSQSIRRVPVFCSVSLARFLAPCSAPAPCSLTRPNEDVFDHPPASDPPTHSIPSTHTQRKAPHPPTIPSTHTQRKAPHPPTMPSAAPSRRRQRGPKPAAALVLLAGAACCW